MKDVFWVNIGTYMMEECGIHVADGISIWIDGVVVMKRLRFSDRERETWSASNLFLPPAEG